MDKENVIPAGSMPYETPTYSDKPDTPSATEDPSSIKVGGKEYESTDKLAEAYQNLEKKLGEMGNEKGELKAQVKMLTDLVSQGNANRQNNAKAEKEAPQMSLDRELESVHDEIAKIAKAIDSGDMGVEEAIAKQAELFKRSNTLTAQIAADQAIRQSTDAFNKTLQERDAQQIQNNFLKENPDFMELQRSGALEQIKSTNPMHDDLSAYYALKAQQAMEAGKAQQAALDRGAEQTKTVLTKPGGTIRQQNQQKPRNEAEAKARMMQALQGIRAGQG